MAGDSAVRRAAKSVLAPALPPAVYRYVQAISMARDIRSGALTEPELDLVPRLVAAGDTAIDVGANYGLYVSALARAAGAAGRVWAFEPIPHTVETLRLVVRLLRIGNVEVVAKGCAERPGSATFTVPLQGNGAISAGQAHVDGRDDERPGREEHVRWPDASTVPCELVALDDFVERLGAVSLIKLDVEGGELPALRGATRLLDRDQPAVICEVNPWFLEGYGISVGELLRFFDDRGYAALRYRERRLVPVRAREMEEANYVFLPERRRRLVAELIAA